MAAITTQRSRYCLRSDEIAILVIHGIGEQNPYETLDSFARGIFRFLKHTCQSVNLSSLRTSLKDWTQVGMQITVNHAEDPKRQGHVDIFEYYWAPETEDKLSWKDTLKWLVLTDLRPLRYFADNLLMEMKEGSFRSAMLRSFELYAREIARVLILYVPLAASLLWLLGWLASAPGIWSALKSITVALGSYPGWPKVVLSCYALSILMLWFTLQSLTSYLRRGRFSIERLAEGVWFGLAFLSATMFLLAGFFLSFRYGVSLQPLWAKIFAKSVLYPFCAALIAAAWSYILTAYVADVAVYVSSDAKSKNYAARTAILKASCEALKRILVDKRYDRVILAGHSLGSVIAYDTINELLVQVNSNPGPADDQPSPRLESKQLKKLTGLVTFGSPLDKIYYFFREHVKADQAIRAQILSMLYSFRKVTSQRDYGPFKFGYKFDQLDQLVWLNAYAHMDFVSAKLKFYDLKGEDNQRSFRYWLPGLAHLSYWGDSNFYSYFGERLLISAFDEAQSA